MGRQNSERTAASNGLTVHFLDYISMNMKHWWNYNNKGELKYSQNLSQGYFINHKSHIAYPSIETRPWRWEAGDWYLSPPLTSLLKTIGNYSHVFRETQSRTYMSASVRRRKMLLHRNCGVLGCNPDDGGRRFLRMVGNRLPNYTAPHHRRHKS